MAEITSTSLGELLKRLYSNDDIEMLANLVSQVLEKCAAKGNAMLGGAGFYGAARLESSEGHAFIAEDGALPDPQQTLVKQWLASPTVQVGVVQLTGLSKAVSSQNSMAFANAFDENVQHTIESMTAYKEGTLFRDGTGALTTFTADAGASAGPWTVDDAGFLREGMSVIVYDASTAGGTETYFGPYKINIVDWVNDQVTFSSAVDATVTTSDVLYLNDSQGPTGTAPASREPLGFEKSILSTGNYLGIDRATYGNWRSSSFTVSAALDEDILMRARTRIIQETGLTISAMGQRFALVCHQSQADQLFKLAIPRIHYAGVSNIDLVNAENVAIGKIPVLTSYQCLPSRAYMGDWSKHKTMYAPGGELHIDTEHNGAPLKWVSGYDKGQVYMKSYFQFVNTAPNHFCRFASITEASR